MINTAKNKILLLTLIFLSISKILYSQNWIHYNTSNSNLQDNRVGPISVDQNGNIILGLDYFSEMISFDGSNFNLLPSNINAHSIFESTIDKNGMLWVIGNNSPSVSVFNGSTWQNFNSSNSIVPDDPTPYFGDIYTDKLNNKWIGFGNSGLIKYDNSIWSVYDTSNSGISSNNISSICEDTLGNIWIITGPNWTGLNKFDGISFTIFYPPISTNDFEYEIAVDRTNNLWLGTSFGLLKFDIDSNSWTTYHTNNSNIPDTNIKALAVDTLNNLWVGTLKGLAKFNGSNWIVYDTSNSGLPDNYVTEIEIDQYNNKWLSFAVPDFVGYYTGNGFAVFNETGIILNIEFMNAIALSLNIYPNPISSGKITLTNLPQNEDTKVCVYNILGEFVYDQKLVSNQRAFNLQIDMADLPGGIYMLQVEQGESIIRKKIIKL